MSAEASHALVARFYAEAPASVQLLGGAQSLAEWVQANPNPFPLTPEEEASVITYADSLADALRASLGLLYAGFPDWRYSLGDVIAEGRLVAARVSGAGTHTGHRLARVPAGKRITVEGLGVFAVHGGRIVRMWHTWGAPQVG